MRTDQASVKPGDLPHRITLEVQPAELDRNSLGEPVDSWSAWREVWANVEEAGSRELLLAQQVNPELTHRITIRWRAGVTAEMRVNWRGRIINLDGPPTNPDGRRVWLVLLGKEIGR
jgi:SPP1 family predicted phage head-tail adaptor